MIRPKEWHEVNNLVTESLQIADLSRALRHADRGILRDVGHEKLEAMAERITEYLITVRDTLDPIKTPGGLTRERLGPQNGPNEEGDKS